MCWLCRSILVSSHSRKIRNDDKLDKVELLGTLGRYYVIDIANWNWVSTVFRTRTKPPLNGHEINLQSRHESFGIFPLPFVIHKVQFVTGNEMEVVPQNANAPFATFSENLSSLLIYSFHRFLFSKTKTKISGFFVKRKVNVNFFRKKL